MRNIILLDQIRKPARQVVEEYRLHKAALIPILQREAAKEMEKERRREERKKQIRQQIKERNEANRDVYRPTNGHHGTCRQCLNYRLKRIMYRGVCAVCRGIPLREVEES